MLKTVLFIAFVGHILCGICDCLLGYSPSGRLDIKGALKSSDRMREVFKEYPIKWSLISIMLGVYAITLFGFGHNRNDIASSVGMRVKYTAADVAFGTYKTSC